MPTSVWIARWVITFQQAFRGGEKNERVICHRNSHGTGFFFCVGHEPQPQPEPGQFDRLRGFLQPTASNSVGHDFQLRRGPGDHNGGKSATLTGIFENGAGVINPGALRLRAEQRDRHSTATTTYTLTVTPSVGKAVTATAQVVVQTTGAAQTTVSVDLSTPGVPVTIRFLA